MDIFDPQYDVEIKKVICTEYNMNKFIDGEMVYVLNDDYKQNIILVRDFNT